MLVGLTFVNKPIRGLLRETSQRFVDSSIRWWRQRAADWRAVGGVIDWLGEIGRTFDNISRI